MARRSIGIPKGKLRWTIANLRIDVNTSDNPSNIVSAKRIPAPRDWHSLEKETLFVKPWPTGYIGRDL